MAAQFSAKMEALRLHRRAFEDALLRVERVARSSLNKEQSEPRRDSVQAAPSPSGGASWTLAQVQENSLKTGEILSSNPPNFKGNSAQNPSISPRQESQRKQHSRNNSRNNEQLDDKISTDQAAKGDSASAARKTTVGRGGVIKAPGNNDLKAIMTLPDPDEERSHETLIAARHALWQQSYLRIQSWLRASEAITMDSEHNRAIHRELGDLSGES
eukprot:9497091-Pyramimonas_sp.AAC.2